jgi:predicted dehydrogenase/threonine dehydrogenase-like Zn-dependent dehydrogenase
MKQVVQNLKNGKTEIMDVPAPRPAPGAVLVRTAASVVSVGTERSVVDFAGRSLLGKARSRPDLVRQMIQKGRREGWLAAVEAAFSRLGQPMALGYSSAGVVVETGEGVSEFHPGDRVACAGGGHAVHAEFANVPVNLMAVVPDGVDLEEAAFGTLGAIAMHGFRLSGAMLGESVAVIGLGLLGLLAAQIAQSAGCRVFGIDVDGKRVSLARKLGIHAIERAEAERAGRAFTGARGFDAVLVCADTPSADPLELAGALSRDRGKVVAVGAVGMTIPRKSYYEKEIEFLVSRSYGPGRYDPLYEEAGVDYPYGFVRWTEQRNIESFLGLLAGGKVRVAPLITHRFPVEKGADAYRLISGKDKKAQPFLGILLTYPKDSKPATAVRTGVGVGRAAEAKLEGGVRLGILGAGNFATMVALPAIAGRKDVEKVSVVSAGGLSAKLAARKFGFARAAADPADVLNDPAINTVGIFTRHHLHAAQAAAALRNGKNVFCEKPLALNEDELRAVEQAWNKAAGRILAVGFNRRFAPMAVRMKNHIAATGEPPVITIRVNAGTLPQSHWTLDPAQGGGRILGEACHFVDLMTFLADSLPVRVTAGNAPASGADTEDNFAAVMEFANGSVGSLVYSSAGDRSFGKERVEVFCGGNVAVLEDFRRLDIWRDGVHRSWQARLRQDKGHRAIWDAFLQSILDGGPAPIPVEELFAVTRATFALLRSMRERRQVTIE